jgi:hypothetical protein
MITMYWPELVPEDCETVEAHQQGPKEIVDPCRNRLLGQLCPYVCPEPVLAN